MEKLKGITWNHSRGHVPLIATAQRYAEINQGNEIDWKKRSLQDFADTPIEELALEYDLLVIDHLHIGVIAENHILVPLEKYLSKNFLVDQQNNQVGNSYDSYNYNTHQWALALDVATPVASWREDQFTKLGLKVLSTWNELLKLEYVALPTIPVDSLLIFFLLCIDQNDSLFAHKETIAKDETVLQAMEALKELIKLCDSKFLKKNPIKVYDSLVSDKEKEISQIYKESLANEEAVKEGCR